MTTGKSYESPLRLENLGNVSGYYGNLPTMKGWSPVASISSDNNSGADQLRPAKGLHRAQQDPELNRQYRAQSTDYPRSHCESQTELCHPAVLTPGPRRRAVSEYGGGSPWERKVQPFKSYTQDSRPFTSYLPYRPPETKKFERPPSRIIHSSVSICGSPDTYSTSGRADLPSPCYSTTTSSYTPAPPPYSPRDYYSFSDIRQSSQVQHSRPRSQTSILIDGVAFDLVTPNTFAPIPTPVLPPLAAPIGPPPTSAPTLSPSRPSLRRGRGYSASSTCSTRSNGPAYGSLNPSPRLPKQASFIDRARARLQRGLVHAGWQSPPSFKVHSVSKSPSSNNIAVSTYSTAESSWAGNKEPPCGSSREIISGPPTPPPSPPRRGIPLHIDTNFTDIPLPIGVCELEAPHNSPGHGRGRSSSESKANHSRQFSFEPLLPQRDAQQQQHPSAFDDRRILPSHGRQHEHTLLRKQGMQLR
ncbi:hypothetical protein F4803DRAFT_260289 [Xylaria telfairii]|nr:hypothetical protein F4803DRAFT_260289 [Xylaria telfairii]